MKMKIRGFQHFPTVKSRAKSGYLQTDQFIKKSPLKKMVDKTNTGGNTASKHLAINAKCLRPEKINVYGNQLALSD